MNLIQVIFKKELINAALLMLFLPLPSFLAGQVAINADGSAPNPSAMLDVKSNEKGVLVPRMTTSQRNNIDAPANGLLVYDLDDQHFYFFNGFEWVALGAPLLVSNKIADADGNTQVQTEKNPDEDIIRFDLDNKEKMRLVKNSSDYVRLEFPENGSNTFLGNNAGLNSSSAVQPPSFGARVNTFVGEKAGQSNISGSTNTATGHEALFSNTSGEANTAIGTSALWYNQTGNRNTGLGAYAYGTIGTLDNATVIGFNAPINSSNKVRVGNSQVTVIEGQVDWSFPSDARFKYNVHDDNLPGLAFVQKLHPVTYQFDARRYDEYLVQQLPDKLRQQHLAYNDLNRGEAPLQTGFLAQEVEQACKELNFQFSGLHVPENDTDNYSLAYGSFVPLLVKAVQEQQTMIAAQKAGMEHVKVEVEQVKAENALLRQQLNQLQTLEARMQALENKQ